MYYSCRSNKNTRPRILKSKKVKFTPQQIQDKFRDLIEKENCIPGMSISYEQLKEWHLKYGRGMQEIEFARMLQITDTSYYTCKTGRSNARILVDEIKDRNEQQRKLTQDEIRNIIMDLTEQGYVDKSISYDELQALFKKYGEVFGISESTFAQKVLGINYMNYATCKNRKTKVIILKDEKEPSAPIIISNPKTEVTQEEIQNIISILTDQGYIGKRISWQELQDLYDQHGKEKSMSKREFAQKILGIPDTTYDRCRKTEGTITIRNGIIYSKSKEILRLYINESKFYSKEDIIKICEAYDISIEDFITYVYTQGFIGDISHILEALEKNNGLWIGKTRLSEEFANINIDLIQRIVSQIVNKLCLKYHRNGERQDYIQEATLYVIENLGEVEKNFGHDLKKFEEVLTARIRKYCKGMIIQNFKVTTKQTSLHRGLSRTSQKNNATYTVEIPVLNINIEETVIQAQVPSDLEDESDRCIKLLSHYIEEGYDKTEAIAMTAEDMNIEPDKMLEYMQHYLITNGKVKTKPNGTVEWDPR